MSGSQSAASMRVALDQCVKNGDFSTLSESFSFCECEEAQSTSAYGPLEAGEELVRFVASRFDFDIKRKKNKVKRSLDRALSDGASFYRVEKWSSCERKIAARIQYDEAKRHDVDFGGLIGWLRFSAKALKSLRLEGERLLCVYETPIRNRQSHVDVVTPIIWKSEVQRNILLTKIRNAVQSSNVCFEPISALPEDVHHFSPNISEGQMNTTLNALTGK